MSELLLDRAGRRRSPATMPGFHACRPPRNKGVRYPADPPKVEEIVAVMRAAGESPHGRRLRGLIVVAARCWSVAARADGGARSAWTPWGWAELRPWLEMRVGLPIGPLFCVLTSPTRGRQWSNAAAGPSCAGRPSRPVSGGAFAPHQLRHAHAVELAREGVPLIVIQRQLGHSNLGITSVYLQGIDSAEIIDTVHARRAPMSRSARRLGSDQQESRALLVAQKEKAGRAVRCPPPPSPGTAAARISQLADYRR